MVSRVLGRPPNTTQVRTCTYDTETQKHPARVSRGIIIQNVKKRRRTEKVIKFGPLDEKET